MGAVANGTLCDGGRIKKAPGGYCSPVGNLKCKGERGFFLCDEGMFAVWVERQKVAMGRVLMVSIQVASYTWAAQPTRLPASMARFSCRGPDGDEARRRMAGFCGRRVGMSDSGTLIMVVTLVFHLFLEHEVRRFDVQ